MKCKNYLVKWYDIELEQEDSEIVEATSSGEAEQMISEGNKFAEDISATKVNLYVCPGCGAKNTASKWNSNTTNCLWGDEVGFFPIEEVQEYVVLYYNCPSCNNRINNKSIRRIK
jgi:uncharacterized protein YlaI